MFLIWSVLESKMKECYIGNKKMYYETLMYMGKIYDRTESNTASIKGREKAKVKDDGITKSDEDNETTKRKGYRVNRPETLPQEMDHSAWLKYIF